MVDRNKSYDGLKGILLIISFFIVASQVLLVDFKDWQYGMEAKTFTSKVILYIHYIGRLSLIFLGTYFAHEFKNNIGSNFFIRKIISYIVVPIILYSFVFEYIGLWWMDISTIGFAFICSVFLARLTCFLKYSLLIIFSVIANPMITDWDYLSNLNVVSSIVFGDFTESIFLNLASVIPVVLISSFIFDLELFFNKKKTLYPVMFFLILFIVFYFLNYYYLIGGLSYRYPPHILEYILSFVLATLLIWCLNYPLVFLNYFSNLGKHVYKIYLISILFLYLMTEQVNIGSYKLSFIKIIILMIIYFMTVNLVINRVEIKNGKEKND